MSSNGSVNLNGFETPIVLISPEKGQVDNSRYSIDCIYRDPVEEADNDTQTRSLQTYNLLQNKRCSVQEASMKYNIFNLQK